MVYTVVFVREDDGRYSVHVPALPGCHTWGENLPHSVRMVEEAMQCHVASLQAHGDTLPTDVAKVSFDLEDASEALVYRIALPETAQVA